MNETLQVIKFLLDSCAAKELLIEQHRKAIADLQAQIKEVETTLQKQKEKGKPQKE